MEWNYASRECLWQMSLLVPIPNLDWIYIPVHRSISQAFLGKNTKFLCSLDWKFPEFFKTHPTLICSSFLWAFRSISKNPWHNCARPAQNRVKKVGAMPCRGLLVLFAKFWYFLVLFVTFWYFLVCCGTFWYFLVLFAKFWYFWPLLATYWYFLVLLGSLWCYWPLMTYYWPTNDLLLPKKTYCKQT